MGYRFVSTNQSLIDETRRDWTEQIEASDFQLPAVRFLAHLDSAERRLNEQLSVAGLGGVCWYVVVAEESDQSAVALVEIVHARTSKSDPDSRIKMLNLRLSPELDSATGDATSDLLRRVRDVLATLFDGVLEMSGEQSLADTVKIYCERDADAGFFEMVAVNLNQAENNLSLDVSRHGRWVVLRLL